MYALKLQNGSIIGNLSLVSAVKKMRNNVVVVAVVELATGEVVVGRWSNK